MALGIQMIVVTGGITLLGYWLDVKMGRRPFFLIVFFVVGSVGGIMAVWRALTVDLSKQQEKRERR